MPGVRARVNLRSTINDTEASPETIPSRIWLRSVSHVTRTCIASTRFLRTRSCCLACGDTLAVIAMNHFMCIAGDRDYKQQDAEVQEVVRNDARRITEQARA